MRIHGGFTRPKLTDRGDYRNLFASPERPSAGPYVNVDPEQVKRTERMLLGLAARMGRPYPWKDKLKVDGVEAKDEQDNPNLPSGYTYLAQLIAHDLSFLGAARPRLKDRARSFPNFRANALKLDTMYGGGPKERPAAYCTPDDGGDRHLMRLGYFRTRTDNVEDIAALSERERRKRARDLPRLRCPFLHDKAVGAADVLIADPRNDDHPVLAQLLVLFSLLHNAICEMLKDKDLLKPAAKLADPDQPQPFTTAREAVVYIYQRIVKEDFLRRLLNEAVYRGYASDDAVFVDQNADRTMPIEFSHAAFRFGHAMVRPGYQFNNDKESVFALHDVLREGSAHRPQLMPLPRQWIIQWSHFFQNLDRQTPTNLSLRLAPAFVPTLFDGSLFEKKKPQEPAPNKDAAKGAKPEEADAGMLPYRDLLRGGLHQMQSVESLVRSLEDLAPDWLKALVQKTPLLSDRNERRRQIEAWLNAKPASEFEIRDLEREHKLSDPDKKSLAADPPLMFFLLLEAALTEQGQRLGVLGSVIVAEVIFKALKLQQDDPEAGEFMSAGQAAAEAVFKEDGGVPANMPALIRFITKYYQFEAADSPFV